MKQKVTLFGKQYELIDIMELSKMSWTKIHIGDRWFPGDVTRTNCILLFDKSITEYTEKCFESLPNVNKQDIVFKYKNVLTGKIEKIKYYGIFPIYVNEISENIIKIQFSVDYFKVKKLQIRGWLDVI